jgi:hypothetical protein
MSSFVFGGGDPACGTSVVPPPEPVSTAAITNDGWFPDIDPAAFRATLRVRQDVTAERLREAILGAMITVGNDLALWSVALQLGGYAKLADVPSLKLGGESRLVILYRRAVACFAKADLVERYRDVDTTAAGDRKADALEPTIDELRRDGRYAIRDILGRTRTNVELI